MKKITSLILLFLLVIAAYSQVVDENTARKVAQKFLLTDYPYLKDQLFQKFIAVGLDNDTLYYVFQYPDEGYAIISAESSAPPVLGHCKKGKYEPENMPPGLLYLLDKYKYWISSLRENKVQQTKQIKEQWAGYLDPDLVTLKSYTVGDEMIETKWGQSDGYDQFCPAGCPAGCTAVAMAQILKYWECRIDPTGSLYYSGSYFIGGSANFGETTYNWKDMDTIAPDADNALLIYHAGVSCRTHYNNGLSTPGKARDGFVDYWGISSSADVKWRIWHLSNWQEMLENELDMGRPILYSGGNISLEGHSWVIDGYYSDGRFNCNWGWYGYHNGPYFLGDFDPPGDPGPYNQIESAIFNVYPVQPVGVATPQLIEQSFPYNQNGYTITIPEAFGATSYEWSCSHGTIQGSGTTVTLFSECNSTVSVRAHNSWCDIYSDYDSEIMNIEYPITGPTLVCTSNSTFTLHNRPPGTTVNWTKSSNLQYASGQGTDNYTVKAYSSASGTGWVQATINSSSTCGSITLPQYSTWAGTPQITNRKVDGGYYYPGIQICPGDHYLNVTPVGGDAGTATWTVPSGIIYFVGINELDFTFPSSASSVAITTRSTNSCGTGPNSSFYLTKKTWGCYGSYAMTIYPNPASDNVTITMIENPPLVEYSDSGITNVATTNAKTDKPTTYTIRIYNSQSILLSTVTRSGNIFNIPLINMRDGTYIIEVSDGKNSYRQQLIVKHN